MSRAINLRLDEGEVQAICKAAGISISAIEPLPRGGTHVVCTTSEGAEAVRRRCKTHLILGAVQRFPFYRR